MATVRRLTRKSKTAKPFRFLDLPAELRNTILQYAFTNSSTSIAFKTAPGTHARIHHFVHETSSPHTSRPGLPAILQSNKQLRQEGLGIFYSLTTWIANEDDLNRPLLSLLRKLGGERRPLITRLCLRQQSFSGTSERLAVESREMISWLKWRLEVMDMECENAVLSVEIDGPGWRFCWP